MYQIFQSLLCYQIHKPMKFPEGNLDWKIQEDQKAQWSKLCNNNNNDKDDNISLNVNNEGDRYVKKISHHHDYLQQDNDHCDEARSMIDFNTQEKVFPFQVHYSHKPILHYSIVVCLHISEMHNKKNPFGFYQAYTMFYPSVDSS